MTFLQYHYTQLSFHQVFTNIFSINLIETYLYFTFVFVLSLCQPSRNTKHLITAVYADRKIYLLWLDDYFSFGIPWFYSSRSIDFSDVLISFRSINDVSVLLLEAKDYVLYKYVMVLCVCALVSAFAIIFLSTYVRD